MEGHERRLLLPRELLRERDLDGEFSPAMLSLERAYEKSRQRTQNREPPKMPEIPTIQAKSKPRLLLMGQKRYDSVDGT